MKQLSQIIALSIFGVTAIQIILAIGAGIVFLQILVNKISGSKSRCEMRKRHSEIENNMWSIE